MSIVRDGSGKWFIHPWAEGVMPNHPTGYTGHAMWRDPDRWQMWVRRTRPDGRREMFRARASRWRLGALINAIRTETRP